MDGLVCNGHTGEITGLRRAERKRVVEICAEECGDVMTIISGVNCENTAESIEMAKEAKEALGYLDNPESGYQAWVNTSYREKGFVSVSGKGNTKTVTLTANTKYAGKYEVTVTEVNVGKEYKFMQKEKLRVEHVILQ